jgi:hypothetical protein
LILLDLQPINNIIKSRSGKDIFPRTGIFIL